MNDPILVPVDEAARLLGIGETLVRSLIRVGDLPARKIGRRTVVEHAGVVAYAAALPLATYGGAE